MRRHAERGRWVVTKPCGRVFPGWQSARTTASHAYMRTRFRMRVLTGLGRLGKQQCFGVVRMAHSEHNIIEHENPSSRILRTMYVR